MCYLCNAASGILSMRVVRGHINFKTIEKKNLPLKNERKDRGQIAKDSVVVLLCLFVCLIPDELKNKK